MIKNIIAVLFTSFAINASANIDSIGRVKVNGIDYIIHKIDAKETLFAISKRYRVRVEDIKEANTLITDDLKLDAIIRIPMVDTLVKPSLASSTNPASTTNTSTNGQIIHVVEQGQTLYAISRIYGVPVSTIVELNELENTSLSLGQKIIIKQGARTTAVTTRTEPARTAEPSAVNTSFDLAKRKVICEIANDENIPQDKLYVYHNTIAIGSIIKLENKEKERIVFAKVVGKIPNQDGKENVELLMTKAVSEHLFNYEQRQVLNIYFGQVKK